MALSRNMKGALFMALSMSGFAMNDALIKSISHDTTIGQIMMIRGAMTTLLVFLITRHFGALRPLRVMARPTVVLRVFFEVAAAIVFLAALGNIPLANISAILQSLPLAVTLGAALFLKEPTGWRRWVAIIVGFGGVLVIIRPGPEGFTTASLLAIACVFLAAGRDLATKRVPPEIPSLMVTTVTAACITLTGGLLIAGTGEWKPVTPTVFTHLAIGSVFSLIGYQFVILAMRTGEISFIAPFRYTGLLASIALGMAFLGESLDGFTVVGILVVVASGLYTFHREARRNRQTAAASLSEVEP
jgi:drug/metabolite transporter (DMT)-like permease